MNRDSIVRRILEKTCAVDAVLDRAELLKALEAAYDAGRASVEPGTRSTLWQGIVLSFFEGDEVTFQIKTPCREQDMGSHLRKLYYTWAKLWCDGGTQDRILEEEAFARTV